jgi:hypothetical protein
MDTEAYKSPEPKKVSWACPCNGCKKAQKVIIDQIIEEYRSCPNIVEFDEKLYCSTWYKHDNCVRFMELLNKITKKDLYSLPEIRPTVRDAIQQMIDDPNTSEILQKLEDKGI